LLSLSLLISDLRGRSEVLILSLVRGALDLFFRLEISNLMKWVEELILELSSRRQIPEAITVETSKIQQMFISFLVDC
jgi:hypothetical protein